MFNLNFLKLNKGSYDLFHVALINLYAAWYMLLNLKTTLPNIDVTMAKIYFTEHGINIQGLTDKQVAEMAKEYNKNIIRFFIKCEVQRCENLIDRFGKCGCDPRLPHDMTLPLQCKQFFLELIEFNSSQNYENIHTKESSTLNSLLDSMIVNNTGMIDRFNCSKIEQSKVFSITPEQFSSYTDIIHNAVMDLYRPLSDLDETHEDWGTKFRKVIDYIKTLVFMASRDLAKPMWGDSYGARSVGDKLPILESAPLLNLENKDNLFSKATKVMSNHTGDTVTSQIQSAVAPYSSLKIEHAICLFHNTNAELDTTKLAQNRVSDAFKFLCCQEYIYYLDSKLKEQAAEPID